MGYKKAGSSGARNWDLVWIDEYRQFHRLIPGQAFVVNTEAVMAYLIDLRKRGKKAWQRLQALNAIKSMARNDLRMETAHLDDMASKLKAMAEKG